MNAVTTTVSNQTGQAAALTAFNSSQQILTAKNQSNTALATLSNFAGQQSNLPITLNTFSSFRRRPHQIPPISLFTPGSTSALSLPRSISQSSTSTGRISTGSLSFAPNLSTPTPLTETPSGSYRNVSSLAESSANTTTECDALMRFTTKVSVPWKTKGVEQLAVEVVYALKLWDWNARKKKELMKEYEKGVHMFCETLKVRHQVRLSKEPSWQTIMNRSIKILKRHRAFRNKQEQETGGDKEHEQIESAEQYAERTQRETLYDKALALWECFEREKKKSAATREEKEALEKQLTEAGHASRSAAMGNVLDDTDSDGSSEDPDKKDKKKKKRKKRSRNSNTRARALGDAFGPLVTAFENSNKSSQKRSRRLQREMRLDRELRRDMFRSTTRLEGMMIALAGGATMSDAAKFALDLTKDTPKSQTEITISDSSSESDTDV